MMRIIYNIAAVIVVIAAIPVFIVRSIREKGFIERLRQNFGFLHQQALLPVEGKNCIWVHAASVGEIVATSPLIKEFRREFPDRPILVSVVTNSGYEMAKRIIKDADSIIFFPLDLPWLSSSVVRRIMPSVFLPVETELWPNFLKAARRYHIPVMMVNGRISDKSVKSYRHLRGVLKDMIGTVSKFCMRSQIDADYIIKLGADPSLVTITGNTKFDQTYTDVSPDEKQEMIISMGLQKADGILMAGSTHKGEENLVLEAFRQLRRTRPEVRLVIAPRDIMRVGEIEALCEMFGFKSMRRTKLNEMKELPDDHDVVILDTIGELGRVYSIGDVIYVGGSLVKHGGHNILEPAAHGKAIIVGRDMANFKDTHELFARRNACITVNDGIELGTKIIKLFREPELRSQMEAETLQIINENRGASRKSAVILREMLTAYENEQAKKVPHINANIETFQNYLYKLVHGETNGFFDEIMLLVLHVFSIIYSQLVSLKLAFYRIGINRQCRLDCHVISLGNITVGGTGKTPTAQLLAPIIRDMGYRVVVLNRGYRAKWKGRVGLVSDGRKTFMTASEAGDEAFLLAKSLKGVPVLIGADRAETGKYAVEHLNAQVVILDDGYQHWHLVRDLDILLVDAINVFGNSYMLPRGTLREPLSHLDRADVCLLTKVNQASEANCRQIKETLAKYNDHAIVVESIHQPRCFIEIADWYKGNTDSGIAVEELKDRKVTAVSGIGNPTSFEQTIHDIGAEMVNCIRFPDHHDYTMLEMQMIMDKAMEEGAEAIIITGKDAVKIPPEVIHSVNRQLPVYILNIEISLQAGSEQFKKLLARSLKEKIDGTAKPD